MYIKRIDEDTLRLHLTHFSPNLNLTSMAEELMYLYSILQISFTCCSQSVQVLPLLTQPDYLILGQYLDN